MICVSTLTCLRVISILNTTFPFLSSKSVTHHLSFISDTHSATSIISNLVQRDGHLFTNNCVFYGRILWIHQNSVDNENLAMTTKVYIDRPNSSVALANELTFPVCRLFAMKWPCQLGLPIVLVTRYFCWPNMIMLPVYLIPLLH